MTLAEMLRQGEKTLLHAGVEEAALNAWYLFSHCFQMDKGQFFLHSGDTAEEKNVHHYEYLLDERAKRVPLEYIIEKTEFMGLPFYVDENVLIPRQDTECLVEEVLKASQGKAVLDLCTGSGCIGISLAVLGSCQSVTLADISREALAIAEKNAARNQADIMIIQSDLFTGISECFDIIVSNPPYIPTEEIAGLMPEVRDYEPRLALDGSTDGLLFYRSIITESGSFLNPDGMLYFEIGCNEGEDVSRLMREAGFSDVIIKKDLAGLDRIVQGRRKS